MLLLLAGDAGRVPLTAFHVSLPFAAVAFPQPSYQWCKEGEPIRGANSDTLVIHEVFGAQEGTYTCKIVNGAGAIESAPTSVQFRREAPVIEAHPASASAALGETVTLSVSGERQCCCHSCCCRC